MFQRTVRTLRTVPYRRLDRSVRGWTTTSSHTSVERHDVVRVCWSVARYRRTLTADGRLIRGHKVQVRAMHALHMCYDHRQVVKS